MKPIEIIRKMKNIKKTRIILDIKESKEAEILFEHALAIYFIIETLKAQKKKNYETYKIIKQGEDLLIVIFNKYVWL